MGPHISSDVMLLDSTYALWQSVSQTWADDTNVQRIHQICEKVFLSKQGTKSFTEYYSFVKARWNSTSINHSQKMMKPGRNKERS